MARFASIAELETFLGRLDPEYSQFASALWQNSVRTVHQLSNAQEPILLSCGLPALYIDDIKARADRTGEPNVLDACTQCLIVHRCCSVNSSLHQEDNCLSFNRLLWLQQLAFLHDVLNIRDQLRHRMHQFFQRLDVRQGSQATNFVCKNTRRSTVSHKHQLTVSASHAQSQQQLQKQHRSAPQQGVPAREMRTTTPVQPKVSKPDVSASDRTLNVIVRVCRTTYFRY